MNCYENKPKESTMYPDAKEPNAVPKSCIICRYSILLATSSGWTTSHIKT